MTEDRFDDLMHDAERTYNGPPPQPDFDAMWKSIERQHFGAGAQQSNNGAEAPRFRFLTSRWMGIAATLVVGIGIGRVSMKVGQSPAGTVAVAPPAVAPSTQHTDTAMARPYEVETSRYLGQTAALLVSLPSEIRGGSTNPQFASRAAELLSRTRLLIDSPAATDPAMRDLLEDLELVLMQIVRLQGSTSKTDLDLINRALEQRDVIPRLRTAAADISAN